MKICYVPKEFSEEKQKLIAVANDIIADYHSKGFDLTVRQIYYQFVARAYIPNQPEEYAKLQSLLNDARLAGLVDWDAIVDRTRHLRALAHQAHPRDVLAGAKDEFQYWLWENQPNYVEVWVEKDALLDIVASIANPLDVGYFSCRGYTSVSEMHSAAMRFKYEIEQGKQVRVIHLGDHDPSGIDMTRDITERLQNVFGVAAHIYRVALNRNQIDQYNPPPNPAKLSDSRATKYIAEHGEYSWELDALEPTVMAKVVEKNVLHWRDEELWAQAVRKQERARRLLGGIHDRWNEVTRMVKLPPLPELQQPIDPTNYGN
jgi:hypothetical protein